MSEQTPDTDSSVDGGQDPSMEDILASIRKIIAEDDKPDVSADEDSIEQVDLETVQVPENSGDISSLAHTETLDLDILAEEENLADPDIEALIGDMDEAGESEMPLTSLAPAPALSTPLQDNVDTDFDEILSLEIPMDEVEEAPISQANALDENIDLTIDLTAETDLVLEDDIAEMLTPIEDANDNETITLLDDEVPLEEKPQNGEVMGGAMAALGLGGAAAVADDFSPNDAVQPPEDDLSLMLDNMLEDSSSYQQQPEISAQSDEGVDPVADLLAEIQDDDIELESAEKETEIETDPDMDLVKSLMADLTEEPLHDESSKGDDESEAEAELETVDIDDDESSDDVMGEILSMTLDDETKLSEEIAIPELSAEAEAPAESMSLKDIAAAAAADAENSERKLGAGLVAAAAIGGAGAALAGDHDDAPEDDEASEDDAVDLADTETITETIETPTPENIIEETPTMARAKKSDAIIDEVTETATAGAFASLTNVVEEKATVAERGDRIGDLVMEALQPMLKEWLDANLKGIVERAVTKEVKRISSGK